MDNWMDPPAPVALESGFELSTWLGRREAFGLMAGRCSAADVACLRRIRDGKMYLSRTQRWGEFCLNDLHMSKSNANHLIGLLDEFGSAYFHIAQITRISVAEYRAIESAVSPRGIEANGEFIPLNAENHERIAAAISALRAARGARREPEFQSRLAALDAAGNRLLKRVCDLSKSRGHSDPYIDSLLENLRRKVVELQQDVK